MRRKKTCKRCSCPSETEICTICQQIANRPKVCPRCGGPMEIREGYLGEFWGCITFPKCAGTITARGTNMRKFSNMPNPVKVCVYYPFHDITTAVATTDYANLIKIINDVIRHDKISGGNVIQNGEVIGQILQKRLKPGATHVFLSQNLRAICESYQELEAEVEVVGSWDSFPIVGI